MVPTAAEKLKTLYEQQGFLTELPVLSITELQEAREAFTQLEREFGEEYTQYSLHNVHLKYDWVMGLVKHPKVLEPVKAILGPDVILLDSRFICKYPTQLKTTSSGEGSKTATSDTGNTSEESKGQVYNGAQDEADLPFVAWHQDIRYWGLDGGSVLSVWLALDDSREDNGALQVIPGTHRSGLLPHQSSASAGNMLSVNQEIPEDLVETEKAVLCPLLAGQMSVHDGFLVHGSNPNTSNSRRCGFVIRYVPTCVYPTEDPDRPRRFAATALVCGNDKFNHFKSISAEV
ncbi:hypothetical protein Z043_121367 [Scleropages formosus]|uniref:Zgc:174917 n=1 Tax=Scleropages formosus TaxID=113540 RepID=A0A0N8JWD3_SCLFO|nr:uncharacterized protein LOC108925387 [Scleropages formosus]KPP60617.1 hypothetical protein Z043_121367 [Scleropages formosus]